MDFYNFRKKSLIIYFILLLMLIANGIVLYFMKINLFFTDNIFIQEDSETLLFVIFVILILLIPGSNFLFRKLLDFNLDKDCLIDQLKGYLTSKVIIWSLFEVLGTTIAIAYLLSGNNNFVYLFIGVIYLLLRNFPTLKEIRNIFQTSISEIERELLEENKNLQ